MTSDACQAADDDVNKCWRLATSGCLIAAAAAAPSSSATRPPAAGISSRSAKQQHERRARSVAGDHWPASHVNCRRHCVAIGQQQQQQQQQHYIRHRHHSRFTSRLSFLCCPLGGMHKLYRQIWFNSEFFHADFVGIGMEAGTVTVTVTAAFVVRLLQLVRWRIL